VTVPSSLTFISECKTTSQCVATCYRQDGDLLVGTSDGLYVLYRGWSLLSLRSTDFHSVTSMVEHHQNVFILHNPYGQYQVELCLTDDITKRRKLFQFSGTSNKVAVMAVSNRYVVVKNPDTHQLIIYDFTSQRTEKINSKNLIGLQFLPDGCLLGVCEGKLQKYKIENRELIEIWTCDDIKDGYSPCADSNGLIYVTTTSLKKIYIISSQGLVPYNTL